MTAGPYSIGSDRWPGLAKAIEECGEVIQAAAGKIIAAKYTPENTWLDPKRNQRHCKACNRDRMVARRAAARAAREAA